MFHISGCFRMNFSLFFFKYFQPTPLGVVFTNFSVCLNHGHKQHGHSVQWVQVGIHWPAVSVGLHVLPVPACVSSGYSAFLSKSKDVQFTKLLIVSVNVCLCTFQSFDLSRMYTFCSVSARIGSSTPLTFKRNN